MQQTQYVGHPSAGIDPETLSTTDLLEIAYRLGRLTANFESFHRETKSAINDLRTEFATTATAAAMAA